MTLLFIFDMDDVLYDYDWRARMAGMTRMTGLSLEELRERWWTAEGEFAAEAGGFATGADYLAALRAALGCDVDEAEWVRVRGDAMTVRPGSIAAVRRAAELGQVTLLTNNGVLLGAHLPTVAPELVDLFGDHLFTSSDYGARKPDPLVYERVLESYGVPAERAFFADDMPENIEGAASVGITAHLYESPEAMLAAIEEFAAARS
ncbi:putative hydrolase of the HAD superfamily [Conyzicola lurida]|uniref:Putative hydrolase of the HAD superfamily n=1 Tax=Conyzicola lurida TaxID=1172621 RepID=A0A841ALS3_9MICO|nr:putative hydrolase of the HAD superfamily [Conyzicola lurida]